MSAKRAWHELPETARKRVISVLEADRSDAENCCLPHALCHEQAEAYAAAITVLREAGKRGKR